MISLMTSEAAVGGLTVTLTVVVALRLEPSMVLAVMVAVPGLTPVTVPSLLTVATDSSLDVHFAHLRVLAGCMSSVALAVSPAMMSVVGRLMLMAVAFASTLYSRRKLSKMVQLSLAQLSLRSPMVMLPLASNVIVFQ